MMSEEGAQIVDDLLILLVDIKIAAHRGDSGLIGLITLTEKIEDFMNKNYIDLGE